MWPLGHVATIQNEWFSDSLCRIGADSRFAQNQWETSLQSNAVSHQLGANLKSTLRIVAWTLAVKLSSGGCHGTPLMKRQQLLGNGLVSSGNPAITGAKADRVITVQHCTYRLGRPAWTCGWACRRWPVLPRPAWRGWAHPCWWSHHGPCQTRRRRASTLKGRNIGWV